MDERLRKQYLDAMGIQAWVRRDTVPPEVVEVSAEAKAAVPAPLSETPDERAMTPPVDAEASASVGGAAARTDVSGLDWEALEARVRHCQACVLHETRTQTVFGVGNRNADLMVIGEAPGADEDRQGEPFVGRAGQLLNAMLQAMGLKREQVFIANILKCRPPSNRDPRPEEALCCEPFLQRQIELVAPKVILAAGRVAAQNLLKSTENVGRMRSCVHYLGDGKIPLVVTYHPAYLLRSPDQKAKAWEDLQRAMAFLAEC